MKLSTLLRFLSCCQQHHPKPHGPSPQQPQQSQPPRLPFPSGEGQGEAPLLLCHDILTLLLPLLETRQDTPSKRVF